MSGTPKNVKRFKRTTKAPQNPLFEQWLTEWKKEATENGSDNMRFCYTRALKSLQRYPFKLHSGKECVILENFGAKLCQMLDKKLEEYKASQPGALTQQNNMDADVGPQDNDQNLGIVKVKKRKADQSSPAQKKRTKEKTEMTSTAVLPAQNDEVVEKASPAKSKRKSSFVPAFRSGSYAILLSLFQKTCDNNFEGSMSKTEIQDSAEEFCDTSFKKAQPGSFYTAWSSMSTLLKKELISKKGNPPRFSLTEKGVDLAIQLQVHSNQEKETTKAATGDSKDLPLSIPDCNVLPTSSKNIKDVLEKNNLPTTKCATKSKTVRKAVLESNNEFENGRLSLEEVLGTDIEPVTSYESDETIFLLPGTFEVVLLVDVQETDNKLRQNNDATIRQLKSRHVSFEVRHLKVGDFVWICKDLTNGHELVLPYVVERKRMDDLAGSIKDGRFHEQKFRLKQCGIENLIYLVEKYGNENQRLGLPLPTLQQATSNTQIVDGFTVKMTNNHDDSVRYLGCMTTLLTNVFKDKTLVSCRKKDLPPANISDDLISLMTFSEFNKGSGKHRKFNVRDMLVKHLIQLKGLSVEKALSIVNLYPTVVRLVEALKEANGEKSIASATYGALNRSVGQVASKSICQLYSLTQLK